MNQSNKRIGRLKKWAILATVGTAFAFPFGSCDLGTFQTTSTVTLDGREVVQFLVRSWILTPISDAIDLGINKFFDQFGSDGEA